MAISRMNMERQLRNMGGLMTLEEPRQGYFLGKIVRKAKKTVKKVFKSPLGKAAILGGLGFGLGGAKFLGGKGIFTGGQGLSRFGNLLNLVRPKGIGGAAEGKRGALAGLFFDKDGDFSPGRAALTGLAGTAIAAPFLMGGDEEEEDPGTPVSGVQPMVAGIRDQARQFYRDPAEAAASGLFFMPQRRFVQDSFLAADGGLADIPREGYESGERVSGILKLLSKLTPAGLGMAAGKKLAEGIKDDENMMMAGMGNVMKLFETPYGFDRDRFESMLMEFEDSGAKEKGIKLMDFAIDFLDMVKKDTPQIDRVQAAEGGIMDLGGMEKDYREGGFVPIGAEERADDVPARLSKNEFVFTADAVRNAGGGDIDKGAEVMQNMMDNLEAGGMISEESQGKENPAQAMFDQAQMMESRIV